DAEAVGGSGDVQGRLLFGRVERPPLLELLLQPPSGHAPFPPTTLIVTPLVYASTNCVSRVVPPPGAARSPCRGCDRRPCSVRRGTVDPLRSGTEGGRFRVSPRAQADGNSAGPSPGSPAASRSTARAASPCGSPWPSPPGGPRRAPGGRGRRPSPPPGR